MAHNFSKVISGMEPLRNWLFPNAWVIINDVYMEDAQGNLAYDFLKDKMRALSFSGLQSNNNTNKLFS